MSEHLTARQFAGREAQKRRKGLTPEGRESLRQSALLNRPWEHSTGPRTWKGKRIVRQNALVHGGRAFTVLPSEVQGFIRDVYQAAAGGALPSPDSYLAAGAYFGDLPRDELGVPRLEGITRFAELALRAERVRIARRDLT